MQKNIQDIEDHQEKGTIPRTIKMIAVLCVLGVLAIILVVNSGIASAENSTGLPPLDQNTMNSSVENQTNETVLDSNISANATQTNIIQTTAQTTATATPLLKASKAPEEQFNIRTDKKITQADREAAAENFKKLYWAAHATREPSDDGSSHGSVEAGPIDPNIPHYFGPYPNYANSPMPKGNIASITLVSGGSGYSTNTSVNITDLYNTGSGADILATIVNGTITGFTINSGGTNYSAPYVLIIDGNGTGTGAAATAAIGGPFNGGIRKFIHELPGLDAAGANSLGQYIPVAIPNTTAYPAGGIGYTSVPTVNIMDANGTGANATASISGGKVTVVNIISGGSGYSDNPIVTFSGGGATVNAIGKATVVGGAITAISLTGADYYEIELDEFSEKMHPDLPNTTLRGYRQVNTVDPTVSTFHNLGPLIIAERDRPVRIRFINNLPTGSGGNLSIPVDFTVMGAGMGPLGMNTTPGYPVYYTENRATLHLHGGFTPWISDGTPYQWTTPAGESTDYPIGASVYNVPDMPDPGPTPPQGVLTFYYSNQQSARLMFYHDHSHGITRLNVYAGEAGGYVVTDQVEKDMMNGTNLSGVNPTNATVLPGLGIPLIIQDKTFVDADTIAAQDPTWKWGTTSPVAHTGDLWYPHVYVPAQNPYDLTGVNPFGRWHYGPWFWPPTNTVYGPVPNPYYDPVNASWEPPLMPGTPNPSMAMEAFMDTPVVNGAIYPYLEVEPQAYRFRILNAADDRFFNLQWYVANSSDFVNVDGYPTEVSMVPADAVPGYPAEWPTDGRAGGVPDPATRGPSFIQIGTEGGFLPAPVVLQNLPVNWNTDPTTFNAGNVNQGTLILGCAERADVIVDFSQYAGQTLILYNDAPAAFPALDPRYDYYTGKPDLTDTGGTPTTLPGYGPNTRTIMQVRVSSNASAPLYDQAALESVFTKSAGKRGVFEVSQDPIIVPQADYNSAYSGNFPADTFVRIFQTSLTFMNLSGGTMTLPLTSKAIQDEMGEAFDEYGRMSGFLGLQFRGPTGQQNLLLYGYGSPPIDILNDSVFGTQIATLGDGTQIWKITHNGVDTHPVHWHLFNVQLINRVAWDNAVMPPDPNELGWKETLRVNPLEDTIVAMRPVAPTLPFDLPNSIRPIQPTMPLGVVLPSAPGGGTAWFDPTGQPITVVNHMVNYGWEYVLHCHILAHEEMDMMHSMPFAKAPLAPSDLNATFAGNNTTPIVNLVWKDASLSETNFSIQRAVNASGPWTTIAIIPSTTGPQKDVIVNYTDTTVVIGTTYYYRVAALNTVGDTAVYAAPSVGFPTSTISSPASNIATAGYSPPPTITSITPTSGYRNQTISFIIVGTNFQPGNTVVKFRKQPSGLMNTTLISVNATHINGTVAIPLSATTGWWNLSVTTPGGEAIRIDAFRVRALPTPTFTSITPVSGARNATVNYTIVGTNFVPGLMTVTFRNATGAVLNTTVLTSVTSTQIQGTIVIPSNAWIGPYNVVVTVLDGGTVTGANAFSVTGGGTPAPTIREINPTSFKRGLSVSYTIEGTNYVPGQTTVQFRKTGSTTINVPVSTVTPTTIRGTVYLPLTTTTGLWNVRVTTVTGGSVTRTNAITIF